MKSRIGVKTWSIILEKQTRTRQQEEDVVSRFIINSIALQCGIKEQVSVPLSEKEKSSFFKCWKIDLTTRFHHI